MSLNIRPTRLGVLALVASAWALSGSGTVNAESVTEPVALSFALVAGSQAVDCQSSVPALGASGKAATLKDARFYIHDLKLVRANGDQVRVQLDQNDWQYRDLALVDLEDGSGSCTGTRDVHAVVSGRAEPGPFTGVLFTVGVPVMSHSSHGAPVALNHTSTEQMPAPLDSQAMAWNWQAGRKFMKVEFAPDGGIERSTDRIKIWPVHLGSTSCTGNPASGDVVACKHNNRFEVRLQGLDLRTDAVALDVAELFRNSDLSRDRGGAAGCMSSPQDPECPAVFAKLGLPMAGTPATASSVFRRIQKP